MTWNGNLFFLTTWIPIQLVSEFQKIRNGFFETHCIMYIVDT